MDGFHVSVDVNNKNSIVMMLAAVNWDDPTDYCVFPMDRRRAFEIGRSLLRAAGCKGTIEMPLDSASLDGVQ